MLTKRIIFNNAIVSRFMCSDIKSFSTSAINTNTPDTSKSATYQPVADFYAKNSVLLTGGTGYVGKVIIEKLLDSCKNIDKIFLLVREKKGVNPTDRINEIFDNPLFERLKKTNPSCLKKIIPISGDLTKPKLGLKSNDEQTLLDEVAVVLHSAASVKFNEPLSMSMKINFEGTKEILSLLRRMKKVKSLVYVSTSFAHTHSKVLTETVYPPPAKLEDVYKFIEEFDHDEEKTMEFINGKPNTYTLCKALAESYVAENHGSIPTVIIRPSVVLGKKDEPAKGWMDGWQAAPLLVDNIGRGLNHFVLGDKDVFMDVSPVDYVANTAIVAATRAISEETKVFNCNSSAENPITWDGVFQHFIKENVKYRKNVLPFPSVYYSHSKAVIKALTIIFQTTPAVAADLWRRVQGKEPIYAPMMKHVAYSRDLIEFFTSHSIMMKANNTRALYQSLSPEDKLTYPCDPAEIDWPIYLTDCWKGLNKYLPNKYKV